MKTFITCYGGGHVTMCLPMIRELTARGHEVEVLALTVAGEVFKRAGIAHRRPIDFIDIERVRPYGEQLAKRHHTEGKGISYDESIAYLGVSMENLVQEVGEEEAWARYERDRLNAFCPTGFLKEVLQQIQPDFVLTTTAPRMELASLRAAHDLNIPSLCMIDLFGIYGLEWIRLPENGKYLTVFSESVKRRVLGYGRKPEDIFITGNPAFDALAPYKNTNTSTSYKAAKQIAPNKKIILWAEQPEPLDPLLPRRVREHLSRVCSAHEDWQLVVRLHPSSTDASQEIIPEGAAQSLAHESLQEAIAAADVVVSLTSTVAMEALLLGKPLLIIAISPYQYLVDYSEEDGALIAPTLEDTETSLEQLLTDTPKARALAQARRALPDIGDATPKIADLIEQLVTRP